VSEYTTQLRFIVEKAAGLTVSPGYEQVFQTVDAAVNKIFDFDWPIFDESYRNVLSRKILLSFYTREICCETVGLWKLRLYNRLNEIMPYYNQLYKSAQLEFNPLYDVDLTTKHLGHGSEEGGVTGLETSKETISGASSKEGTDSKKTGSSLSKDYSTSDNGTVDTTTNDHTLVNGGGTDTTKGTVETTASGTEGSTTSHDNSGTAHSNTIDSRQGGETIAQSDTPQGSLDNVLNKTYLSYAEQRDKTEGGTSQTDGTSTDKGTTTVEGENSSNGTTTNDQTVTHSQNSSTTANGGSNVVSSATGTNKGTETGSGSEDGSFTEKGSNSGTRDNAVNRSENKTAKTTEDYITTVTGKNGGASYSKLIMEYRESLINIDQMVINDLDCLFMQIW